MPEQKKNALDMSDEDFMNADPSMFEEELDDDNKTDDNDEDGNEGDDDAGQDGDDGNDSGSDDDNDDAGDEGDDDDANDDDSAAGSDSDDSGDSGDGDDGDDQDDDDKGGDDGKSGESAADAGDSSDDSSSQDSGELTTAQLADIGRMVMGEFKANGQTMKVKSGEDAITLMQMGANYHKKMAGLKPALKNLKLLENHGLMDPQKLNFLIDLHQKKPEAIKQLLKDSKVDPIELDLQDDGTYVPKTRTVNDNEILLDEVLDSISHTPNYQRTLKVIADDWDESSQAALANDPVKIRVINQHMETGIFDQVIQAVNYERSLGKLAGVSDYDAYLQIGHRMHTNKEFVVANRGRQQQDSSENQDSQQSQRKSSNTATDEARSNRKKAASPNRQKQGSDSSGKKKYDPLAMSDEEFAKLNNLNL